MGKKTLPPGFRFHPTDVELVKYYLKRKVLGKNLHFDAIAEIDIYKYAPWDLPDRSNLRTGDLKWYFFCPREKKYASGTRMNRATDLGYWKTTGKDRTVQYNNEVVGMIKTLVFHRGKAPKGERTDWVMYEYRLKEKELDAKGVAQDAYVLCSIFKKDGPGPRNGAQYGAPFKEEDWDDDDDEEEEFNGVGIVSSSGMPVLVPINQNSSLATSSHVPEVTCTGSIGICPYEALPSASNATGVVVDDYVAAADPPQYVNENEGDDILAMLANFYAENPSNLGENDMNEAVNIKYDVNVPANPQLDGIDIYRDLGDLGNLTGLGEHEDNISSHYSAKYSMDQRLEGDNMKFLELMDLETPLNCSAEVGGYEQLQNSGLYAGKNCCFNPEDLYRDAIPSSTVELVPGFSQSPIQPSLHGFEDRVNVFGKENCFAENANMGYKNNRADSNGNANPCETSEIGSACAAEPVGRGVQQRNSSSIFQYSLESVPACPVSAAEHSAPIIIGVKRLKGIVLLAPNGGSSIRVKAEVTLWTGGCTDDALSDKLEESTLYNLIEHESEGLFRFTFFFFLGIINSTQLSPISKLILGNVLNFFMFMSNHPNFYVFACWYCLFWYFNNVTFSDSLCENLFCTVFERTVLLLT
ncbi:NAC domain-containing protein 82 isoform X2 [Jatropha curcas]|uniref:NAC domain-containing protein 82 isoform X2 n=1 Tax=Jatropha curcas TaxID=180498 RepID=UPI0005FB85BC|nr:NAC domain-containing protein 82 isoform X2 [Jatropha curcas]